MARSYLLRGAWRRNSHWGNQKWWRPTSSCAAIRPNREQGGQSGNTGQRGKHQQAGHQQQGAEAALAGGVEHGADADVLAGLAGVFQAFQQGTQVLRVRVGCHVRVLVRPLQVRGRRVREGL